MKTHPIATAVTTDTTTEPVTIGAREQNEGTLVVAIGGTVTAQVQGQISDTNGAWVAVGDPFTETGGVVAALFERYRVVTSGGSGSYRVDAAILI